MTSACQDSKVIPYKDNPPSQGRELPWHNNVQVWCIYIEYSFLYGISRQIFIPADLAEQSHAQLPYFDVQ